MTTLVSAQPKNVMRLSDAEIGPFLATTPGIVVVDVSATWCMPCRLIGPIVHKLAAEFAGRMTVVEIDGDAADGFCNAHAVNSFPQLLFFNGGALVERQTGFTGAEPTRATVAKVLGRAPDAEPTPAEQEFRATAARAQARFEVAMEAAGKEVNPHFKAIEPALDAFEASLKEELAAGRISADEVNKCMGTEYERLREPFADKIAVMRQAMSDAVAQYETAMAGAVERFARQVAAAAAERAADDQAAEEQASERPALAVCRPGDPFCTLA